MRIASREFLIGAGTMAVLYLFRKPLKKAAVSLAGGLLALGDQSRELFYNLKEEAEDIIAEAGYEHMKHKVDNEPANEMKEEN